IEDSTISQNRAGYDGGGISSAGILTVTNSSIINNTVYGSSFGGYGNNSYGGGINNSGVATVINSTVSGNNATAYDGYAGYGGGIANAGTLDIVSSTVSDNQAQGSSGSGGGLFSRGGGTTTTISSSIVGDNSASNLADIARVGGGATINATKSLIEVDGGQVNGTNTNNIFGLDPKLNPAGLNNNGGPTQTIALLPDSPAINAGAANGLSTDQRGTGFNRVVGGQADIGAFEVQSGGENSNNRLIRINRGSGTTVVRNFGGFGPSQQPTPQALANLDTLKFSGRGLTARNLLLRNRQGDLLIEFDGIPNTRVVLTDFQLQNLDNSSTAGNIIFAGQSKGTDSIDVIGQSANPLRVARRNITTFLNDTDNRIDGRDNSNDVINAQNGNDKVFGLSGNDVLRGRSGNDTLGGGGGHDLVQGGNGQDRMFGGSGNDTMFGGAGNDVIRGNENNDVLSGGEGFDILTGGSGRDIYSFSASTTGKGLLRELNTDRITDFKRGQDKIGLDKQTFTELNRSGRNLKSSDFASVANDRQVARSTREIVFSRSSGRVFYNANGSDSGLGSKGGQFAILNGVSNLATSDFTFI
ncbi:MAG: calcium-binding protein, partial [Cyanobacteria bacterium P01_E01_bin.34]